MMKHAERKRIISEMQDFHCLSSVIDFDFLASKSAGTYPSAVSESNSSVLRTTCRYFGYDSDFPATCHFLSDGHLLVIGQHSGR